MEIDQHARSAILGGQRKQLDVFLSDVSPKISRTLTKAKTVLAAYEEENAGIILPSALGRDLGAAIKSLERIDRWARTEFSMRTTELADLVTAQSSSLMEPERS